ncbi:MAG: UDP-N-acetylmuramate--L-alanine ligase [Minisyncoccia bacterium]
MKKVYFVGIKGVGMCGLANIMKSLGYEVLGSDTKEKFFTDDILKRLKIRYFEGFKKDNLPNDTDLLIVSQAYAKRIENKIETKNIEVKEAIRRKIPILLYPEALGIIFNKSFGIAVCGTHGKSTVSAMIGEILNRSKLDFIALVGSEVINWKSNSILRIRKKRDFKNIPFVIEADEYRGAFLNYKPEIIVITNLDYDHPDFFKNPKEYKSVFEKFLKNLKGKKILITNEKIKLPNGIKKINVDYSKIPDFKLKFFGEHYKKNAYLAYLVGRLLGIKKEIILKSLKEYRGIKRRFEYLGEVRINNRKIKLIDDYAHHPKEIESILNSLKEMKVDLDKVWLIFQPHTFTRTYALFDDFLKILSKFKNVIILKTYASAREKGMKDLSKDLAKKLKGKIKNVKYFADKEKVAKFLKKNLSALSADRSDKEYIITCGAGDVWKVIEILKNSL